MMVWEHEYAYHDEEIYKNLLKLQGLNILVYGPKGCSKREYVGKYVKHCINISCEDWKWTTFTINDDKKTDVSLFVRQSRLHVELILCEFTNYQKYFVKHILKPIVKNLSIANNGSVCSKLIVIYNLHLLHIASQQELRTLIEKYSTYANFVFVTSKVGNIINTIVSNTTQFRISRPSTKDLNKYIKTTLAKDNISISTRVINNHIELNDNHVTNVISSLQFYDNKIPNEMDKSLNKLCEYIISCKFKQIREMLYIIMINNVHYDEILTHVVNYFKRSYIARYAAIYSHKLVNSERVIYHLEAFTNNCVKCILHENSIRSKNIK